MSFVPIKTLLLLATKKNAAAQILIMRHASLGRCAGGVPLMLVSSGCHELVRRKYISICFSSRSVICTKFGNDERKAGMP